MISKSRQHWPQRRLRILLWTKRGCDRRDHQRRLPLVTNARSMRGRGDRDWSWLRVRLQRRQWTRDILPFPRLSERVLLQNSSGRRGLHAGRGFDVSVMSPTAICPSALGLWRCTRHTECACSLSSAAGRSRSRPRRRDLGSHLIPPRPRQPSWKAPPLFRDQQGHRWGGTCLKSIKRACCATHRNPLETEERKLANSYSDPELRYNKAELQRLIRNLLEIRTCDLTMYPQETIGLFVVKKDEEKRQRPIVVTRWPNEHFKSSPPCRWVWWRVWTRSRQLGHLLTLGSRGLPCLRPLRKGLLPQTPKWMHPFLSLAPSAQKNSMSSAKWWTTSRSRKTPWCTHVKLHLVFLRLSVSTRGCSGRIGRASEAVWRHDKLTPSARSVYLNNVGIISTRRTNVVETQVERCDEFEMRGLRLHKAQGNLEVFGVELDQQNRWYRTTRATLLRLRLGLKFALRRRLAGLQLEAIGVHCSFVGLLRSKRASRLRARRTMEWP